MQSPVPQKIDYSRYLHLLWKWKWFVMIPAVIMPLSAGYYAMQLQDQFMSSTLILVQAQKVPTQFVPTTITTSIDERLQTISQQIFSRTRLEQIIQEFNLFEREKEDRTPEEIVNLMRSRIDLKVHRNDAFQLSFIDANPRLAMLVTNKLASLFIEENLKVREQQAIGTSQFLADEIDRYRERVREKEKTIYDFKRQYMEEMPEQLASNQSRLVQLQNQLQINTQNINSAEDRRLQVKSQLDEIERRVQEELEARFESQSIVNEDWITFVDSSGSFGDQSDRTLANLNSELSKRRTVLESMRLSYTDKHPEIVRLLGEISQLEKRISEETRRVEEEQARAVEVEPSSVLPPDAGGAVVDLVPRYPIMYERLKDDLARIEDSIVRMRKQNDEIQVAIEMYQNRIAASPGRQLQLQQLSEDYGNLRSVLDSLIDKKLQADLAENLERKQKGEQFQILDPANLPEKPFSPKRLTWVAGGLFLGLVSGLGVVLLFDFLSVGVKSRQDLEQVLAIPVLGSIPEIVTPADLRRRRVVRVGFSGAVAVCLLAGACLVHWKVKPLPEAVRELGKQVQATHWTTMRDISVGRR